MKITEATNSESIYDIMFLSANLKLLNSFIRF